jgi:hypothetical protein
VAKLAARLLAAAIMGSDPDKPQTPDWATYARKLAKYSSHPENKQKKTFNLLLGYPSSFSQFIRNVDIDI